MNLTAVDATAVGETTRVGELANAIASHRRRAEIERLVDRVAVTTVAVRPRTPEHTTTPVLLDDWRSV